MAVKLDCDRVDTAEVGGLFGGVSEEGIKMAKASLQYSRSHYSRDGVSEVPIAGQKTRVLEEDSEGWCYWSGCSCYEVNGGRCGLCLVKEYKELEEGFGTQFTDKILGRDAD